MNAVAEIQEREGGAPGLRGAVARKSLDPHPDPLPEGEGMSAGPSTEARQLTATEARQLMATEAGQVGVPRGGERRVGLKERLGLTIAAGLNDLFGPLEK